MADTDTTVAMYKLDYQIAKVPQEPYTTTNYGWMLDKLAALKRGKQTTSIILTTAPEDRTALTCISYD